MKRQGPVLVPGRGVVRQTSPEFEVVLPGDVLFVDSQSRFLMTRARADIVVRNTGGELWRVSCTPFTMPRAFDPDQRLLFFSSRCPYIEFPGEKGMDRYCKMPTAARAEFGYCADHKDQLLVHRAECEATRVRA